MIHDMPSEVRITFAISGIAYIILATGLLTILHMSFKLTKEEASQPLAKFWNGIMIAIAFIALIGMPLFIFYLMSI